MDKVEHPIPAHEESDENATGIIKFGVALAIGIAVICLLMWTLFKIFKTVTAEEEAQPPPLFRGERLPPEPRLQGMPGHQNFPAEDIREFRAKEDAQLNSYGWVDRQAGIVHIPIEEAKRLIVERGLTAPATQNTIQGKK
jgi:hypothetical protein